MKKKSEVKIISNNYCEHRGSFIGSKPQCLIGNDCVRINYKCNIYKKAKPDMKFIEWLCSKAEGFRFDLSGDGGIWTPDEWFHRYDEIIRHSGWKKIFYPQLLTRAIEGINKISSIKDAGCWIVQQPSTIEIFEEDYVSAVAMLIIDINDIDFSKEQVLRFLYEMEKEK